MKINWGTGIVISFVLFIGFILFLIIMMTTNTIFLTSKDKKLVIEVASESNNLQHELVVEDYYNKELAFQEEIDAETNAQLLSENVSINRVDEGLLVIFPDNFEYDKLEGSVFVYRPSNQKLDFEVSLNELTSNKLILPSNQLIGGRWNISVFWKYDGVNYLYRDKTTY